MRRGLAALLVSVLGGLVLAGLALPSSAQPVAPTAAGDVVDRMRIDYEVTPDGVLRVKEEIVYRFGEGSGRHGMFRDLVIREKYVDDGSKDQRYDVSDIRVSSLSGHSAEFTEETLKTSGHRDQTLRLKIGSADRVIIAPTATYLIEYDVRGALRHFDDHSELYWDATGAWDAILRSVTVKAKVPGGVTRAECLAGRSGSTATCAQKATAGGEATYSQTDLRPGEQLTIVAGIGAGLVRNDTPILDDPPALLERLGLSLPGLLASLLATAGAITAGVLYARNGNRDQRFGGTAPGTVPPPGAQAPVVKDELREDQIPVAFSPPDISVGEGGLVIDSRANTTETAATLIDLAVRRAIRIENLGSEQRAVLLDPMAATRHHEQVLVASLFPSLQPGSAIRLKRRPTGDNSMRAAHDAMIAALRGRITEQKWYVRMPRTADGSSVAGALQCGCLGLVAGIVLLFGLSSTMVAATTGGAGRAIAVAVPVLAVIVAAGIFFGTRAKGRRSPVGRAVADQLIGFRTYLGTAEADQLRFEEGEDIFSRYLPWAIAFGLAERWQQVCAQLVAAGRIPADPYWYSGPSYYTSGYSAGALSETVANTFDPPPPPANSGGGGGSSSGFSGGSSGGGGGGGGGGSW